MEIIYGIRNGVKGRFNEQSWPIAERAGWELVTDSNDVTEPPVEVITFLRDQPLVDVDVKVIDFTEPESEFVESDEQLAEADEQPEGEDVEQDELPETAKPVKKITKPRGRGKAKK